MNVTIDSPERTVPALAGYHHIGLTVRDVEASEAWYGTVLGLVRAFVEKHDNETGYAVVMTRPGTHLFLGLDHHEDADRQNFDARRTGLDHLALAISTREALDEWVAHLDALGVDRDPINEITEPVTSALVTFRDLDGISLELIWFGA